jgi:hypothetical protein
MINSFAFSSKETTINEEFRVKHLHLFKYFMPMKVIYGITYHAVFTHRVTQVINTILMYKPPWHKENKTNAKWKAGAYLHISITAHTFRPLSLNCHDQSSC